MSISEEDTYSSPFSSLNHPIRRKILRTLFKGPRSFSEMQRQMGIESSHLTYHLEGLGSLLLKTEDGKYGLSSLGEAAVSTMNHVEEPSKMLSRFFPSPARRASVLRWLTFLILCGLVASLVFNGILALRYADSNKAYNVLDKAYNGLDQAYMELNGTFDTLNQTYLELSKTNPKLENAYVNLSESYLTLVADAQPNRVRDVNTGTEFTTIQEAINAAESGDTVLVGSGVYDEHLLINKTLTLLGIDRENTVIDGLSTNANPDKGSVGITINSDNVVVDGFTVRNCSMGVYLDNSNGSTVSGTIVTLSGLFGIFLDQCDNTIITGNTVSSTLGPPDELGGISVEIGSSMNNTISDNCIVESPWLGIALDYSSSNWIQGNTIENIGFAVQLLSSDNNTFYHNFIDSSIAVINSSNNSWSVGGQGNYWGDYAGLDNDGDGVGDTGLPWHGVDGYPLINPVNPIMVFWDNEVFPVSIVSNSTVSAFTFDQANKEITFNVIGPLNTTGFVNISIPSSLLSGVYSTLLDGGPGYEAKITQNITFTNINGTYDNGVHHIQITGTNAIPEYSTSIMLMLVPMLLIILATIAIKRRLRFRSPSDTDNHALAKSSQLRQHE